MERDIQMRCVLSREEIPAIQEEQLLYLLVELSPATKGGERARLPLDICLLLDSSSSMRGERLFPAKEAARYVVQQLTPDDYFCLITFNDRAEVVVPRQAVRTPASIRQHIDEIEASGGTEMARGLEQCLEQMYRVAAFSGIRRIILLTDGQTYGDENRCVELARQAQEAGIGITALGLGAEWNEDLLATMTAHGNSRSEYIAGSQAIVPLFREEMRMLQGIVAQDMILNMRPTAPVSVRNFYRVAPEIASLSLRETWERDQEVPLGEWMGTGPQAFLAELFIPPLAPGKHRLLQVRFAYRLPREGSRRELRYDLRLPCTPGAPAVFDVPAEVRVGLERVMAYRLQDLAWQDARRGNIEQATRRLAAAATRLVALGEDQLAQVVREEAQRLNRTGQTSPVKKKEISYGTQRLGRRWTERS